MRRASIITISIMFVIIVGLTGALVYTNLPHAEETQSQTAQKSESQTDESSDEVVTETPTEVPLDSDIVADMYNMLNGTYDTYVKNIFHYVKKGVLTVEDLSDEDIQTVAYNYKAKEYVEDASNPDDEFVSGILSTNDMDSVVKLIFGDIEYEHTYAYWGTESAKILKYDDSIGAYYQYSGFGRGDPISTAVTAISKVEEYSDRYIVTEKLLYEEYIDETSYSEAYWLIYPYYCTDNLYADGSLESKSTDSVTERELYPSSTLISSYYDEATEYKHTFMKNEDGTYYWVKTEIVK